MAETITPPHAGREAKENMPYLSKKLQAEKLEAQVEAQRLELVSLRNELRIARAERDTAKSEQARHWQELTILHRVFDKLLLRLDRYEGVDDVTTLEPNEKGLGDSEPLDTAAK